MVSRVSAVRPPHDPRAHPRRIRVGSFLVILSALLLCAVGATAMEVRPPDDERSVIAPLAAHSLLLDGARADGSLVAVGQRGHVLLSDDVGRTWTQVEVPVRATLTGVCFQDRQLGWIVGHDQVILRTQDGGHSWERVHYAPTGEDPPLFDVWFRDAHHGFAIGAYGLFLESVDGGTTWDTRWISEDDFHLNRLVPAGDDRLIIAAEAGTVYRSEDGGETWAALDSPYEGSFFGALWLGGDDLLLFGLRGHLFRSQDGGDTWETVPSGTEASLTDGVVLGDGRVVVVGLGGTLLLSDDNGHSFTLRQQEDRKGINAVLAADAGTVVLFGEAGAQRVEVR